VRSDNPKEHSVFTTRLALGFAVVLAAAAPLPAGASADYHSRANIARMADSIDYAAYVRRGAYGRTVVRRGPYRTVVRHRPYYGYRAPYYRRVVVRRPYYGYRAPYYGRVVVRRPYYGYRAPYYGRVVVRRPYYGYRAPYYGRTVVRRGPYRTVVRRRGW
jgi:hypothetical protein